MLIPRIISFIVLFFSVIFFPWPYVAGLSIILMAIFPWFWEAILIAILLGALYTSPKGYSKFFFIFFAASFILTFFFMECFKRFFEGRNVISYILIVLSGAVPFAFIWFVFKTLLEYV